MDDCYLQSCFSQAGEAYLRGNHLGKAIEVYMEMRRKGWKLDIFSYNMLLHALAIEEKNLARLSRISAVLEENNLLHETYKSSKKDLHTVIEYLKEHLREKKSNKYASKARMEGEVNQKSTQALSTNTPLHGTEVSQMTTLKFIFGVALVSVVIGIILGKKY